jgi:hypothetical protein
MADLYDWEDLKVLIELSPGNKDYKLFINTKKKKDLKGYEKNFGNKKTIKTYKESNLMKGRYDLKKNKSGKYSVDTEMNIKKDLEPKVKRALIKSIIEELNKNFDCYEFFYQKKN